VEAEDRRANDRALRDGSRVLSAYQTAAGRVWLIIEADRPATTVLLPEDNGDGRAPARETRPAPRICIVSTSLVQYSPPGSV
jgi:hypothetical protein